YSGSHPRTPLPRLTSRRTKKVFLRRGAISHSFRYVSLLLLRTPCRRAGHTRFLSPASLREWVSAGTLLSGASRSPCSTVMVFLGDCSCVRGVNGDPYPAREHLTSTNYDCMVSHMTKNSSTKKEDLLREFRVREILDATCRVVARHGFQGATIDRVAEE